MTLCLRIVAQAAQNPDVLTNAHQLAQHLGIELHQQAFSSNRQIQVDEPNLVIKPLNYSPFFELDLLMRSAQGQVTRLNLNYDQGALRYKIDRHRAQHQTLIRALNIKAGEPALIIDACTGFGRDALSIAASGAEVIMLENNPVVAALTANALQRAQFNPQLDESMRQLFARMRLIEADSLDYLQHLPQPVNAIYLDPMFVQKNQQAQVKKQSQFLRALDRLSNEEREIERLKLLDVALLAPTQRVVLKRPRYLPETQTPRVSGTIEGKTTRFEIFSPRSN